jgi:exodeoxyribonuclease VII small subunit
MSNNKPSTGPSTVHPYDQFTDRSFESLLEELESVARSMDSGEHGLEQTTDLYERARLLHRVAQERLTKVRSRLDELTADQGSDGL